MNSNKYTSKQALKETSTNKQSKQSSIEQEQQHQHQGRLRYTSEVNDSVVPANDGRWWPVWLVGKTKGGWWTICWYQMLDGTWAVSFWWYADVHVHLVDAYM